MGRLNHISRVLYQELAEIHPRLIFFQILVSLIPTMAGIRLRRELYRMAGISIGNGTVILGKMKLTGEGTIARNLIIGENCVLNELVTFNLGEMVTIEDNTSIGMECLFLTVSHQMGMPEYRGGQTLTRPIIVGRGVWMGARVIVLPGVNIGPGSVIGAGSVVTQDVPANVIAAGVPARVIRNLDEKDSNEDP